MPLEPNLPNIHFKKVGFRVLLNVDVDGEMGVDVSHLVFESLGNADDQIVDEGLDCA